MPCHTLDTMRFSLGLYSVHLRHSQNNRGKGPVWGSLLISECRCLSKAPPGGQMMKHMMSHWVVTPRLRLVIFPSCLTHLATLVAQGGHTRLPKLRPTQIRECLLRSTVYFKVGCLEEIEVRVLCSWCV